MELRLLAILPLVAAAVLGACGGEASGDIRVLAGSASREGAVTVNGSVIVDDHADARAGNFHTVNGDIRIGSAARVAACTSVHGGIVVGERADTGPLESVNGDLSIAPGAHVHGGVSLVNGRVSIGARAEVAGSVATVNGEIAIAGALVQGDVVNYNGAITVTEGSRIMGDLIIRDTVGINGRRVPSVVIGPHSVVGGRLVFERPVRLYVHETASVSLGGVAMARPDAAAAAMGTALVAVGGH